MTATPPIHTPSKPVQVLHIALICGFLIAPLGIMAHLQHREMEEVRSEYFSTRTEVLATIQSAVANRDLETLRDISAKFTDAVREREFRTTLSQALAEVTARQAEAELQISKHLDLARHREESSLGRIAPWAERPVHIAEASERLSVLPQ